MFVPVIATNCASSFNFNGYDTKPLILFVNRNAVLSIKVVNRLKIMKYAVRNWGGGGLPSYNIYFLNYMDSH